MRSNTPARMHVVKKEEKETNLRAFIQKDLENRKTAGATDGDYRLVARSLESPVARAMASLSSDITDSGIAMRLLLTQFGAIADAELTEQARAVVPAADIRVIRDVRFLDAHEQLVVSPTAAWIGDCMRREPSKRDAYECFAPDSAEVAGWANTSFERLWAAGEPLDMRQQVAAPGGDDGDSIAVPPVAEAAPAHEASTRH